MWIDHFGDSEILNRQSGEKARLEFKKCGWFSKGRYEVSGWILNSKGETTISLGGKWNESITATVINGPPFPNGNLLWNAYNEIDTTNQWGFSSWTEEIGKFDKFLELTLPKSDSRFRSDIQAMLEHDMKKAGAEKRRLEEKQRMQQRLREQKGDEWEQQYFKKVEDDGFGIAYWKFTGNYWKERDDRIQKYIQNLGIH